MKLIKTASGKTNLKISRKEWENIGKEAKWMGLPDDVNLNFNYELDKTQPSCPKCGGTKAKSKENKLGKELLECPCGYKWTE